MTIEDLFRFYSLATKVAFNDFLVECSHPYAYGSWLANTFVYVSQTVPTMLGVASSCSDEKLKDLLRTRALEELGHDRKLVDDMLVLGISLDDVIISPQAELLATITKSIPLQEECSLSLLVGHMLVLEAMHASGDEIKAIAANFGVPLSATSTFQLHSEVDADHSSLVLLMLEEPLVDKYVALSAAVRVLQIFRDHWVWMKAQHGMCSR